MQLSRRAKLPGVISFLRTFANLQVKPPNFIQVGVGIVKKESFLALYKGLGGIQQNRYANGASCRDRNCAKDGDPIFLIRIL